MTYRGWTSPGKPREISAAHALKKLRCMDVLLWVEHLLEANLRPKPDVASWDFLPGMPDAVCKCLKKWQYSNGVCFLLGMALGTLIEPGSCTMHVVLDC